MVSPFEEMPGIIKVVSGYTGGHKENPTYEEVCSETTGYREAVQITFDPEVFPYDKLLDIIGRKSTLPIRVGSFTTEENPCGQLFIP
ncbi:peptide-methionine (S)-S-oxide reductase [Paenibacillus sp. S3N08]|uniref:peptide-methionine (S)-S-oxide reductase n=1 Tax=Paenibacillus agricola TaxID=2716264 RepID=A0ABX0JDY8_9BACL|nr:peptide-methionine (S)-S-oxide reductase [Paenibacillus agricola]